MSSFSAVKNKPGWATTVSVGDQLKAMLTDQLGGMDAEGMTLFLGLLKNDERFIEAVVVHDGFRDTVVALALVGLLGIVEGSDPCTTL